MAKGTLRIEIVSPVRNRREITLQCLRSLERIDAAGLDIHTIIVDDGSIDGTSDAIRQGFPDVEIIYGNGNLWCSGAANLGIERALQYEPDYILLINDDTVFDSNFLQ
ncbi:MAG: glycosyltransferase, partial [Acidobacteriota bacterium]